MKDLIEKTKFHRSRFLFTANSGSANFDSLIGAATLTESIITITTSKFDLKFSDSTCCIPIGSAESYSGISFIVIHVKIPSWEYKLSVET